jgi:putative phosphoesterase
LKRIGVISDTHGHLDSRIAKYFSECDEIWHAGDIGDLAVTDALREMAPLRAVYGNIDGHLLRTEFPLHQRFILEDCSIWMTHIGGKPPTYNRFVIQELQLNTPKVFICGHSHICKVEFDKRLNMLYINPGAAGIHGFHKIKTIVRFKIDNGRLFDMEVIELGVRTS